MWLFTSFYISKRPPPSPNSTAAGVLHYVCLFVSRLWGLNGPSWGLRPLRASLETKGAVGLYGNRRWRIIGHIIRLVLGQFTESRALHLQWISVLTNNVPFEKRAMMQQVATFGHCEFSNEEFGLRDRFDSAVVVAMRNTTGINTATAVV